MSTQRMLGTIVFEGKVLPEWIDVNRHMNVAYYVLAFDLGVDKLWDSFGITNEYMDSGQGSTFAVESHVTYQNELHEGEPFIVTSQILGYDDKRIHQFQRLYHAEKGFLAATAEWMNLHVDLEKRRVSPWPDFILEGIARVARSQSNQSMPAEAGKQMSIANPLYTIGDDQDRRSNNEQ
jgi:acyl-CoA thioester hydrolase